MQRRAKGEDWDNSNRITKNLKKEIADRKIFLVMQRPKTVFKKQCWRIIILNLKTCYKAKEVKTAWY